jgi:hypothetical protein
LAFWILALQPVGRDVYQPDFLLCDTLPLYVSSDVELGLRRRGEFTKVPKKAARSFFW